MSAQMIVICPRCNYGIIEEVPEKIDRQDLENGLRTIDERHETLVEAAIALDACNCYATQQALKKAVINFRETL